MKKLLFGFFLLLLSAGSYAAPNEKVLSSFKLCFPKADSVNWYENETDYEVHFNLNGTRCLVWYDREGNITKSIRYYLAAELSPMILASLQHRYANQHIFGVTELTNEEGVLYYIVL